MAKRYYNKTIILISLILLILLIFTVIVYGSNSSNTTVQKYLNNIYINREFLKNKYKNFINKNSQLRVENGIIIIDDFLDRSYFNYLYNQFNDKKYKPRDFYYRKATSYNFLNLHKNKDYSGFLELYYSNELLDSLSAVLKKPMQRTPLTDNNACSLLIYSNKGDYIDWHLDTSLYSGDRYVVLITLVNENEKKDGLSNNEFIYIHNNKNYTIKMRPNSLIMFKGSEIYHKSTAIKENERRILLSMVFCDICYQKLSILSRISENIKNFVLYN